MITSARCSRSTQWPETRIGSTCGALSVILLPFGFLCCCRVLSMWILQLSHCLLIWGRCQGWLTLSSSCTRCYSVSCCLTLVHAHLHSFIRTCSFSLVRVCFHWHALMCLFSLVQVRSSSYALILTRYGFVLARSRYMFHSCSFAFVLICLHSFSVVQVHFSAYAFVFMCTRLFSLVRVRSHLYRSIYSCTCMLVLFSVVCARSNCSQWYALIFSDTHSFLVVHTCSRLYALVLTCMHSSSPAYPYPLDDTEPQFTAVTTDSSKEVDVEGRGKRRRVANTQYKDFWQH